MILSSLYPFCCFAPLYRFQSYERSSNIYIQVARQSGAGLDFSFNNIFQRLIKRAGLFVMGISPSFLSSYGSQVLDTLSLWRKKTAVEQRELVEMTTGVKLYELNFRRTQKKITTKFLIADLTLTVIQHTHTISTPRTPWTMIKRNFLDIKIMTVDNVATVPFVLPVTLLLLAHPSRKFVDLAMNVRPIRSLFKRLFYDWQGKDVFYKQRKKSKSIVRIFYLDTKGMKKEIVRAPCSAIDLSLFFEEKKPKFTVGARSTQ